MTVSFSPEVTVLALILEYAAAALGMGYGTTITPVLLMMGYSPGEVIPAVLLSQLIAGLLSSLAHHGLGNVNLRWGSHDMKVAAVLSSAGFLGTVVAVLIAISIPPLLVKLYVALLVLGLGLALIWNRQRDFAFSWTKVAGLGLLAAFNKGLSGGGYGPLVVGGQILAGVESRTAIGITALAESFACLVGVVTYFVAGGSRVGWNLAPSLLLGAILSVPLAALTVRWLPPRRLRTMNAGVTTLLGGYLLLRLLL